MKSKSILGIILTLAGAGGLIFSIVSFFTAFITRGAFTGITLLGCLFLLTGVTLVRDRLTPNN